MIAKIREEKYVKIARRIGSAREHKIDIRIFKLFYFNDVKMCVNGQTFASIEQLHKQLRVKSIPGHIIRSKSLFDSGDVASARSVPSDKPLIPILCSPRDRNFTSFVVAGSISTFGLYLCIAALRSCHANIAGQKKP